LRQAGFSDADIDSLADEGAMVRGAD
jgi:hypothetical protein